MSVENYMKIFLQHKEKLDDVERRGDNMTSEESYDGEFMKIRELSLSFKIDNVYPSVEAMKSCNIPKNRFKDIVPFDYTRVKLKTVREGTTSDYINASYIRGAVGDQVYIAAQGPMPKTVNDFWQMIWENDVRVMLMACREYEGEPPKLKCQRYWPNSPIEELSFGDIKVTLEREEKTGYKEHLIRHLVANVGGASRKIVQFHYMNWPDTSVPRCIPGILDLIERLREVQPLNAKETPPVLIHCSAGCGRTGSLLVIDFVASLLKHAKLTEDFKLYDVIVEMRRQRMAIVQSLEQYVFVHEVIAVLFKRQLELNATCAYENVDTRRTPKPKEQSSSNVFIFETKDIEPKDNSLTQRSKPPTTFRKPSQTTDADGKATTTTFKPAAQLPVLPITRKPCPVEAKSRMKERVKDVASVKENLPNFTMLVVYEAIPQEESPVSKANNILADDVYEELKPESFDRGSKQDQVRQIKSKEASRMMTDNVVITYKGINISYPNRFSKKPRGQRPFRAASTTAKIL